MSRVVQAGDTINVDGEFYEVKRAVIAAATSGNNELLAAVTGYKIRVIALSMVAGAAGDVYITSASGGTVIWGGSTNKIKLAANQQYDLQLNVFGWFQTAASQALNMNASSTGPFSGGFLYIEVP